MAVKSEASLADLPAHMHAGERFCALHRAHEPMASGHLAHDFTQRYNSKPRGGLNKQGMRNISAQASHKARASAHPVHLLCGNGVNDAGPRHRAQGARRRSPAASRMGLPMHTMWQAHTAQSMCCACPSWHSGTSSNQASSEAW